MYTVIWQESIHGELIDHWDRFEDQEDVLRLLSELKENENVCEYDVWIFLPEADDYAKTYEDFLRERE